MIILPLKDVKGIHTVSDWLQVPRFALWCNGQGRCAVNANFLLRNLTWPLRTTIVITYKRSNTMMVA